MRRITTIAVLCAVVLLIGVGKLVIIPANTVAGTEQLAVPVHDLHVNHPGMRTMPVAEIPLP